MDDFNLDDVFVNDFLREYDEKEQKKILLNRGEQAIALKKSAKLEPIRKFLQKFVDLEIKVYHSDRYNKDVISREHSVKEAQKFLFYDMDTSSSWAPGISIWFDHPALVEIAIPNKQEDAGVVIIKVASYHPESYMLEQKFLTMESACHALAKFLGKNTLSIGKDPRKIIKQHISSMPPKKVVPVDDDFLSDIPNHPPEENDFDEIVEEKSISNEKKSSKISLKVLEQIFNKKSDNE